MGIIYFISVLALITTFLLWQKKEEKLNFLKYFVIAIVLEFCYNIVLCYALNLFKISINLVSISIINFIFTSIMLVISLKKRKIQKYYIAKKDIFAFFIIILFVSTIAYLKFGWPLEINYETGDPSTHFTNTLYFADNDKLVDGAVMPGAYINTGLAIKALSSVIDYFYNYQIFVGFDIFMWLISALMMYVTLVDLSKTKGTHIIILIVTLLYTAGYPLNSLLFGFEYLSMAIIIMNCIICIVEEYKEKIIQNKQVMIIMFLLETSLSFTYLIFMPIIYGTTFLYLAISLKKEILKKENLLGIFYILVIPFIIGAQFNILPLFSEFFIENPSPDEETILKLEGWIYRNLYSNILLLFPIPVIYLNNVKSEEKSFSGLFLFVSFIMIALAFFAFLFELMSSYYEAKLYFMIWIVLMYMNAKGLIYLYNEKKLKAIIPVCAYIICVLAFLFCRNIKIENYWMSNTEKVYTVAEIYEANKYFIKHDIINYSEEKIELLKYIDENFDVNKEKIGIVAEDTRVSWAEKILNSPIKYISEKKPIKLEEWKQNKEYDYVVYFTDSKYFIYYRDYILDGKEVVFQNESGGILKNNN